MLTKSYGPNKPKCSFVSSQDKFMYDKLTKKKISTTPGSFAVIKFENELFVLLRFHLVLGLPFKRKTTTCDVKKSFRNLITFIVSNDSIFKQYADFQKVFVLKTIGSLIEASAVIERQFDKYSIH